MSHILTNPVLKGFNPDPSIICVGEDYYIAVSTFEWFPGVQIYHSKDLANWRSIGYALNRTSQLDMLGNPDSCGVWAPCLSYADGVFYLVYSNVRSFDGTWKDTPNFLVTTTDIESCNWSEPIFLDSNGFDASLFHDDNGKKWYSSMIVDHRRGKFFGGIILQEYDPIKEKLVGSIKNIFPGSELGITEAPHHYKRNGYYYLVTAEGGTEYNHSVTMARSKDIWGPYEVHPENPIISASSDRKAALQKAGHASFIEAANGKWYGAFLVGRPISERGRCPMGRETAIAEMEWRADDWLYHVGESCVPKLEITVDDLMETKWPITPARNDFNQPALGLEWNALRVPISDDWCSLVDREGYLRLIGRESLSSWHRQSLIAQRVRNFSFEASTAISFQPETFQHMAGLICYYNTTHYYYLYVTANDEGERVLSVLTCDKGTYIYSDEEIVLPTSGEVELKAIVDGAELQFYYKIKGEWKPIAEVLDFSILSDDYIQHDNGKYRPAFTGAFVGLCNQDLTGHQKPADFNYFEYKELD